MIKAFSAVSQVNKLFLVVHTLWLLIIAASVYVTHMYLHRELEDLAVTEARAVFNRDLAYRNWIASHGGIYVPVSPQNPPDHHLVHHPDRDITTPAGETLTLMTPPHILHQVRKFHPDNGLFVRLTSSAPMCADNEPDGWEKTAMLSFRQGQHEVQEFVDFNNEPYLRYMEVVQIQGDCLHCHDGISSGGDIIYGGMSVSLPLESLFRGHETNMKILVSWHILIYLAGAGFLGWCGYSVSARVREQVRAEETLKDSELLFRTVADYAYAWEYWLHPDGSFRYISPSVEKLTGYSMEHFLSDPGFIKTLIADDNSEVLHDHLKNRDKSQHHCEVDFRIKTRDGEERWLRHICRPIFAEDGSFLGRRASNYDITEQKREESEKERLIVELRGALARVKLLSGLLPICANCKKVRDDKGFWSQVEQYVETHSEAVFSHGICPDCCRELYPELFEDGEELL